MISPDKIKASLTENLTNIRANLPDLSSRSTTAIFHCLFKGLQVILYLFSGDSSVVTFILISILIVVDFWTVKNVSGRFLVGLRWWTLTDPQGNEIYHFENYDFKLESPEDIRFASIFWTAQISITVFWCLFLFLDVITFKLFWVCLALIGAFLSGTNTYFYYKARKDHENKIQNAFNGFTSSAVSNFILNRFK